MRGKGNSFFLLTVAIFSFLILWKLLRMYIPTLYFIWDLHIYVMIFLAVFSFKFIPLYNLNEMDILIFVLLLLLSIPLIFYGMAQHQTFIISFILPVFFYYYGRYEGKKNYRNDYRRNIILAISFVIIVFSWIDYIGENLDVNILNLRADYILKTISEATGRTFNRSWDRTEIPYFNIMVMRPQGLAFSQHASSSLLAAIGFYHLAEHKKYKSITKSHLFAAVLAIGLAMAYFVGTTFIVIVFISYLLFNKPLFKLFSAPFFIMMIVIVYYIRELKSPLHYINAMIDNVSISDSMKIFEYLVIGDANPAGDVAAGEIYLLNVIIIVGIPIAIIYSVIFYRFLKYCNFLKKRKDDVLSIKLFVIAVVLGSIHYNTTFQYPTSSIMFYFIGIVSGKYLFYRRKKIVF